MDWSDDAIVLGARVHGEESAVVSVLTLARGRHVGLVRGGQGPRVRAALEPGTRARVRWRARLAEHLGSFVVEPLESPVAAWLDHPRVLALMASACAVAEAVLPERQPMEGAYRGLGALLMLRDARAWPPAYVRWELNLLRVLGYGFDWRHCALTGDAEGLAFVSPKTGRAVTTEAAGSWRDRLLPLPGFLRDPACPCEEADIGAGLALTGHFLALHALPARGGSRQAPVLPAARERLEAMFKGEGLGSLTKPA